MSTYITNDDGSQTEVFTAEELEAQKTAALEEFKIANPDKTEELTKAQEELEKLRGKDLNFGKLREQKEAAEKKVDEILKGVDERVGLAKKEILEGVMKDHYSETINTLTGGDKDLIAKVELEYKRLTDAAASKEEVSKKLKDAYLLATRADAGVDSSVYSSGSVRRPPANVGGLSEDEKDLLTKMGKGHLIK